MLAVRLWDLSWASSYWIYFMTIYFIFGAMGTMLSALGWDWMGWTVVSAVGLAFAMASMPIRLIGKWHRR